MLSALQGGAGSCSSDHEGRTWVTVVESKRPRRHGDSNTLVSVPTGLDTSVGDVVSISTEEDDDAHTEVEDEIDEDETDDVCVDHIPAVQETITFLSLSLTGSPLTPRTSPRHLDDSKGSPGSPPGSRDIGPPARTLVLSFVCQAL